LNVPYVRIDAGLEHGKNDEPWYLALNPNGRVPLLVDGEFSLWESNSIVRYLAAKHGMGTLCPASLEPRAHAGRWMDWQPSTLITPVSIVFWNLIRTAPDRRDPAAIAKNTAEANRVLERLDRHLETQPYVAGAHFTMGDIPVGALAHRWLALQNVERPAFPAL